MPNLAKLHDSVNSLPLKNASLGRITKSVNKIDFDPKNNRLNRWAMQAASADLLPKERVSNCLKTISTFKHPNATNMHKVFEADYLNKIQIQHSKKNDSFYYSNLVTCGSVWHCPVCSAKISELRKKELEQAMLRWKTSGGNVLLLTLTIPHYQSTSLKTSLDGLSDALKRLTNSMAFKALAKDLGLHGRIRSLEVTYGQNGWHPHFHLLLFFYDKLQDLEKIQADLLVLWKRACLRSSLPEPNQHGVNLQCGMTAAEYISKFGHDPIKPIWGMDNEMTKGHIKKSTKGYSPWDLLRNYLKLSDPDFHLAEDMTVSLFREYAKLFKGKRQLVWQRGLREELLGEIKELTDQEASELIEADDELFAQIPLDLWRVILRRKLRGQVLEECRKGVVSFDSFMASQAIHRISTDYRQSQGEPANEKATNETSGS